MIQFYYNINQLEKSKIDIDNAINVDSSLKKSYYYKADLLIKQNKQDEAITLLKHVSEKFENDTVSNKLLGDIYFSSKNYHKALSFYSKALNAAISNNTYMTIQPNMVIVFASDLYYKIAEIYKIMDEVDLNCEFLSKAKIALKYELRPDKEILEERINSSSAISNCSSLE